VNQGHARALAGAGIDFPVPRGERAFGKLCEVELVLSQVGNTSLSIVCATMLHQH
jgi:hypothetical protein